MSDTLDIFLNAALTKSSKIKIMSLITRTPSTKGINIFVSLAGFTRSGKFNNKTLADMMKNPCAALPSDCRYTPQPNETVDSMKSHQREITDSTFDFFNEIGAIQETRQESGKLNIVFLGMTRPTRPFSCIVGLNESELEFYANNNILGKKSDLKKLRITNNEFNPYLNSTAIIKEILVYCENNLRNRPVIYNGISAIVGINAGRFNNIISVEKDYDTKNNTKNNSTIKTKVKSMKVTYLADLMTVAAAIKFKEGVGREDDTFILNKIIRPIKLVGDMEEKFGESALVKLPSFIQPDLDWVNQINSDIGLGKPFICHYLDEPVEKSELMGNVQLAYTLLSYANNFLNRPNTLFSDLHILCDDLLNDFDDLVIRHRISHLGITTKYYANNPNTFELLQTDGIITNRPNNKISNKVIKSFLIKNTENTIRDAGLEAVGNVRRHESSISNPPRINAPSIMNAGYNIFGSLGQIFSQKKTVKKKCVKKKCVRKHKGIVQTGPNKGKLKKAYKYTGAKTATGLRIISKK